MSAASEPITITKITIEPNKVPIDSELKLNIQFTSQDELKSATWIFKYIVDSASKRHVIELGSSPATKYAKGANTFEFHTARIDVSSVKPSVLLNVGLLSCSLKDGDKELCEIKIVTQVNKRKDGVLIRNMFDPLEQ